jgi:UDP-N-acetylglucosamine/UDP-N-acetylgalactosamine diphosphorylase
MNPPSDLVATLARAGQQHLLAFWNRLDEPAQRSFALQLEAVDWPLVGQMRRLAAGDGQGRTPPVDLSAAITPSCLRLGDASNRIPPTDAIRRGTESLGAGQIGAILVAGGQGTRLGCHGPKGLCSIGPVSKANLFEVLLGRLVAVRRRYGRDVPLAIMTSSATDGETRSFLTDHACCGLDPDRVFVFRQHDLPALDAATGDLLLDGPGHLAVAPDGHGGMLVALAEAGGLDWFDSQGVDADFSTQVVCKQEPGERVGVVVDCDGRHCVVEYSDLPAQAAAERLPDGRLRFYAGSIAVHAFAKTFLDRVASRHDSLPLHLAFKAVPFLDADGHRVVPTSPNAHKFERFIFDLMPLAKRVCVVEIEASEGFAPLKNPIGAASDTAAHVHAALVAHARRLLAKAGIDVAEGVDVELAADRIIDETDVNGLLESGTRLDRPIVVGG